MSCNCWMTGRPKLTGSNISGHIFAAETCLDARVGLLKPSPAPVREEEEQEGGGVGITLSPLSSLN